MRPGNPLHRLKSAQDLLGRHFLSAEQRVDRGIESLQGLRLQRRGPQVAHRRREARRTDEAAAGRKPMQFRADRHLIASHRGGVYATALARQFLQEQVAECGHMAGIATQRAKCGRIVPSRAWLFDPRGSRQVGAQRSVQCADAERLAQHVAEAGGQQSLANRVLGRCGMGQRGYVRVFAGRFQQGFTGTVGQVGIDQPQVEPHRIDRAARLREAAGDMYLGGQGAGRIAQEGGADRVVLDQQQARPGVLVIRIHHAGTLPLYAAGMVRAILTACFLLAMLAARPVHARSAQVRIAKVGTPVATLEQVRVRLDWPEGATTGELQVWAGRVDAADLGYRYRDLHWHCPLRRAANAGWECAGDIRSGRSAPMRLAVTFDEATTQASLTQGGARFALDRNAATPDLTSLDLTRVPIAWAQALLAQAWPEAKFKGGVFDAALAIEAPANRPLRISGPLKLRGVGLETVDATIAGENLGGDLRIDYRATPAMSLLTLDGALRGGEFLAGNTYVALPATLVGLRIDATKQAGAGWTLPRVEWRDGDALQASGRIGLTADGGIDSLAIEIGSRDMSPLRQRYLSGWMGLFGLGDVDLHGAMDLRVEARGGALSRIDARLHGVDLRDPARRFVFDGLDGDLRYSASSPVSSELRWRGGQLYGLAFGEARLPMASADGVLRFLEAVRVPLMGGAMTLREVVIRPPRDASGMDIRFGLGLDDIDFGQVSQALGLPAFQGRLSGDIPDAHYADERIDFNGGLSMQLFDGQVAFSALSLERPFGSAPSLSADIAIDSLDLLRLTEVLGFGSITGRLDGRIDGLRLVDWTPVAFDARFITDETPGVKQRISQRAVQNISSVGDASFVTSLQGQLIGLFDDFGYRRIGIGCRLANEVCAMSGLSHSDGSQANNAFTIVQGAGLPRLDVVGFNRNVDWPTLVERLVAVGKGEVAPVIE